MKNTQNGNSYVMRNVARGAAGVALTAGVVALGVAMMDKKNRKKVGQGIRGGLETVKSMNSTARSFAQKQGPRIQAYAQRISPLRTVSKNSAFARGRKRKLAKKK